MLPEDNDTSVDCGCAESTVPRQSICRRPRLAARTGAGAKVVAGGRGAIAKQILNIAFAHGIKVREDADLAAVLAALDVDSEIPVEAFAAVAEILVYVYRANGCLSQTDDYPPLPVDAGAMP